MAKHHLLVENRWIFLEQPWLEEEVILVVLALGLILGMGAR